MEAYAGLRLYPFVRRFNAVAVDDYHKSVDDGFKVTVATPQLVSPECWNFLCWPMGNESYQPNPNPHVNEWHKHNPPPGTAYNMYPRFYHPSLTDRGDSDALLDKLHGIAPYDWDIAHYIYKHRYHEKPDYAQAEQLFAGVTAYRAGAMQYVGYSVQDQPERFEFLLSQAAKLNPYEYYNLADYFADRKEDDKAAGYLESGMTNDPDSVTAANRSQWLVEYYLRKGRTNDASRTADFAGEVYSYDGLLAKAVFLERTHDYPGAYQWYANIEERYDDSGPLINYCLRYKVLTGDTRFDGQVQARLGKIFPKGVEKVSLADFKSAPGNGVLVKTENNLITAAGMNQGDVIVALDGVRVHNFQQYDFERTESAVPVMDLIVWHGNAYHELQASPPNHRFSVDFGDYPPPK
jgi:tetratricopeptide (TPR) repeat protein